MTNILSKDTVIRTNLMTRLGVVSINVTTASEQTIAYEAYA